MKFLLTIMFLILLNWQCAAAIMQNQFTTNAYGTKINGSVITNLPNGAVNNTSQTNLNLTTPYMGGAVLTNANFTGSVTMTNIVASVSSFGGAIFAYQTTATNYTLGNTNCILECTSNLTVTLPTAVGQAGRTYKIESSGSVVTINTTSSELINNQASGYWKLNRWTAIELISNGTGWRAY